MKFLSWLLNVSMRHRRGAIRYARGGVGRRVFIIIVLLCFVGVSLGLEYFCIETFKDNALYGVVIGIFAVAFVISCIEMCSVYCYFGFRCAVAGSLDSIIEKNNKKRMAKNKNVEEINSSIEEPEKKSTKGLDIFIGFLGLILALGTAVVAFLLLVNAVK